MVVRSRNSLVNDTVARAGKLGSEVLAIGLQSAQLAGRLGEVANHTVVGPAGDKVSDCRDALKLGLFFGLTLRLAHPRCASASYATTSCLGKVAI